MPKQLTIEER